MTIKNIETLVNQSQMLLMYQWRRSYSLITPDMISIIGDFPYMRRYAKVDNVNIAALMFSTKGIIRPSKNILLIVRGHRYVSIHAIDTDTKMFRFEDIEPIMKTCNLFEFDYKSIPLTGNNTYIESIYTGNGYIISHKIIKPHPLNLRDHVVVTSKNLHGDTGHNLHDLVHLETKSIADPLIDSRTVTQLLEAYDDDLKTQYVEGGAFHHIVMMPSQSAVEKSNHLVTVDGSNISKMNNLRPVVVFIGKNIAESSRLQPRPCVNRFGVKNVHPLTNYETVVVVTRDEYVKYFLALMDLGHGDDLIYNYLPIVPNMTPTPTIDITLMERIWPYDN